MQAIKLIIWDLDETFWKGTLSEGPITFVQKHADILTDLVRRGIMQSIASKNSFDDARSVLQERGVWDFFVFPKISWDAKGPQIAATISDMQLRPENVLLIDDNHLNLEEARFFCPGIQTAGPDIIPRLISLEACKGKDDSSLSRLKQYRLLERKIADKKHASGSNDDFLRSCNIQVFIGHDCAQHADRILEMINRTNQLNYTKLRLEKADCDALFSDPSIEAGYVIVRDRYGDYGISGFYAMQHRRLIHYLFSCRILHMGVENWLYQKLGCPALEISGDVVTPLQPDLPIDWIRHVETLGDDDPSDSGARPGSVSILVKGGCDLLQIKNYLIRCPRFDVEVNHVGPKGMMINDSHTEIIRRAHPDTITRYGDIIDRLPFYDRHSFVTRFFDGPHDVVMYSVLEDYTRGLYRYRDSDFVIPFHDFLCDATRQENRDVHLLSNEKHRLTEPFLEWFSDNFTFLGPIGPERFCENITWLCDRLDTRKVLIFLNGSEVLYAPRPEGSRWEHHRIMNRLLEETIRGRHNTCICDVRRFLCSPEDHRHNIRHYSRRVYFDIAQEINRIIAERFRISPGFWETLWQRLRISRKTARVFLKMKLRSAMSHMLPDEP